MDKMFRLAGGSSMIRVQVVYNPYASFKEVQASGFVCEKNGSASAGILIEEALTTSRGRSSYLELKVRL